MLLSEVAGDIGIEVLRDGEFEALGFLGAREPKTLSLLYDARFAAAIAANPHISAVLATPDLAASLPEKAVATHRDPRDAFFRLHLHLARTGFYWTDFETEIHPTATIHPSAYVAPRNVRIGANVTVDPHVTILERTIIGEGTVLRPGVVLGTEGFEVREIGGERQVVPHTGGVKLGRNVQIMANTCVCSNLLGGFTEVGDDSVVDNLVHVAHGVKIGKRCRIVASAMLGGSTAIGDDVWVGPNATVSNGLTIGDRARITLGAVVTRDVPEDGHVTGHFAIDHEAFKRQMRAARQ